MPDRDVDVLIVGAGAAGSACAEALARDRSFSGSVWQVSPVIDPQSRQGEVRILVPYDPAIRPGGFAEVLPDRRVGVGGHCGGDQVGGPLRQGLAQGDGGA